MKTLRIDGLEYIEGSHDAAVALAARETRLDAAHLAAHPREFAANVKLIEQHVRTDASGTAHLARDLVHISRAVERTVYSRLRVSEFVKTDTSYPRGAESYARRRVDRTGRAKVCSTLAGDHPMIDVNMTEGLLPFRNVTAAYSYSIDDLERAAFARSELVRWKAEACGEAIARALDVIGKSGTVSDPDGSAGLSGLLNNAFVNLHACATGAWLTETAANILADLQGIETAIIAQAGDQQPQGYRLILPTAYEGRLLTLEHNATTDMTVAKYFLSTSRLIKSIERWPDLDSLVSPDVRAADAPMGLCLPINPDAGGIEWPMPIMYSEESPQVSNFSWKVLARARCGGVEFVRPWNSLYVEGLD